MRRQEPNFTFCSIRGYSMRFPRSGLTALYVPKDGGTVAIEAHR